MSAPQDTPKATMKATPKASAKSSLQARSSGDLVPRRLSALSISEDGLESYLSEIRKVPLLAREEEYMLARRWISHKDVESAHRLVLSHLRLVAKIASGYRGYGLPYAELISEGNIGLLQAVKRFDPERGFRLATYAMWWIRAAIQDYVLRSWSLVKIGTTSAQKKLFFNLRKLRQQMRAIDGQRMNAEEIEDIAKTLGVEERDVEQMHARLSSRDFSLQTPVGESGESWQEWLEDEEADHESVILDEEERRYRRGILTNALSTLKARERDIFCSRHLEESVQTLESLSQRYNVSKERIRQIESVAYDKLRKAVAQSVALDEESQEKSQAQAQEKSQAQAQEKSQEKSLAQAQEESQEESQAQAQEESQEESQAQAQARPLARIE